MLFVVDDEEIYEVVRTLAVIKDVTDMGAALA